MAYVRDTIDDHPVDIAWRIANALNTIGYVALTTRDRAPKAGREETPWI